MNADTVGYRYTDNELAALRLIMALDMPLGCAQRTLGEEEYNNALASLSDAKLITAAGDSVYIDKLTALLLTEISAADTCLRIISQNRVSLLFKCPRLYVIDEVYSGTHTLIPLQTSAEAASELTDALERHVLPAEAALITSTDAEAPGTDAADRDALLRAVHEMLALMGN